MTQFQRKESHSNLKHILEKHSDINTNYDFEGEPIMESKLSYFFKNLHTYIKLIYLDYHGSIRKCTHKFTEITYAL